MVKLIELENIMFSMISASGFSFQVLQNPIISLFYIYALLLKEEPLFYFSVISQQGLHIKTDASFHCPFPLGDNCHPFERSWGWVYPNRPT